MKAYWLFPLCVNTLQMMSAHAGVSSVEDSLVASSLIVIAFYAPFRSPSCASALLLLFSPRRCHDVVALCQLASHNIVGRACAYTSGSCRRSSGVSSCSSTSGTRDCGVSSCSSTSGTRDCTGQGSSGPTFGATSDASSGSTSGAAPGGWRELPAFQCANADAGDTDDGIATVHVVPGAASKCNGHGACGGWGRCIIVALYVSALCGHGHLSSCGCCSGASFSASTSPYAHDTFASNRWTRWEKQMRMVRRHLTLRQLSRGRRRHGPQIRRGRGAAARLTRAIKDKRMRRALEKLQRRGSHARLEWMCRLCRSTNWRLVQVCRSCSVRCPESLPLHPSWQIPPWPQWRSWKETQMALGALSPSHYAQLPAIFGGSADADGANSGGMPAPPPAPAPKASVRVPPRPPQPLPAAKKVRVGDAPWVESEDPQAAGSNSVPPHLQGKPAPLPPPAVPPPPAPPRANRDAHVPSRSAERQTYYFGHGQPDAAVRPKPSQAPVRVSESAADAGTAGGAVAGANSEPQVVWVRDQGTQTIPLLLRSGQFQTCAHETCTRCGQANTWHTGSAWTKDIEWGVVSAWVKDTECFQHADHHRT